METIPTKYSAVKQSLLPTHERFLSGRFIFGTPLPEISDTLLLCYLHIRFSMCFPAVYEIDTFQLGTHRLYNSKSIQVRSWQIQKYVLFLLTNIFMCVIL